MKKELQELPTHDTEKIGLTNYRQIFISGGVLYPERN